MATTTEQARTLVSRAVLWTGLALGTCLAILAITDGVRLRIGGMPSVLGVILGAVMVWVLIVLAAVTLAELVRRHHRAAIRHGWRHGKRGGAAAVGWSRRAAQGAAVRSRPWRTRMITAMQTRWAARTAEPLLIPPQGQPGRPRHRGRTRHLPRWPRGGPHLLVGSCGRPVRLVGG